MDPGLGRTEHRWSWCPSLSLYVQSPSCLPFDAALLQGGVWTLSSWIQALSLDGQRREVSGEVGTVAPEVGYLDGWPSR